MDEADLARERLAFERRKHEDEVRLAEARLAAETARAGRLSGGAVATIGALIALASAGITAALGGFFGVQTERVKTEKELALLEREQQFKVLEQATKGVPLEIAAKNLAFFVDIGYLVDPTGEIKAYAARGEAPQLASSGSNPLLDRMDAARRELSSAPAPEGYSVRQHVLALGADVVRGVPVEKFGALSERSYVILHDTAGPSVESVISWLQDGPGQASYHLIIGRDGAITQLLPFDRAARHAGAPSRWGSVTGLNSRSIGVAFDNLGQLSRAADGSWAGPGGRPAPAEEVVTAVDANGRETGWHRHTDAQIAAGIGVALALRAAYPEIADVLGHDEVSPGRRTDPGPAFPMARFRLEVFGREEPAPAPD